MEKLDIPQVFKKAEIARALFPDNADAPSHLVRKINKKHGQSLNESDKKAIIDFIEGEVKKLKIILK